MALGNKSWLAAVAVSLLCLSSLHIRAAEIAPGSEYARRLKNFDSIQPHGDTPFGEQINLYTGDLSFRQTDAVLEGIGPAISLVRTSSAPMNGEYRLTPYTFGNWSLSIPRIETLIQHDLTIPNSGSPGQQWIIANYNDPDRFSRCSRFDRPLYLGPFQDAWNGMDLYTEDGNQQAIMKRGVGNNLKSTMLNSQGNPIAFPAVTHDHWQIGCLANTSNGEAGEAFFVVSPNGTKYWFDYLVATGAHTVKELDAMSGTMLRQRRMLATMYVSRIEDRFGNYLTYQYNAGKLTTITASDGRQAIITWRTDAPLIDSITLMPAAAQPRTWQYVYLNPTTAAELYQVVLPDGVNRWTLQGVGLPDSSPPYPEFTECGIRSYTNSATGYADTTIIHPSGLVGKFGRRGMVHGRNYLPSACRHAPPPQPDENPYEEIPVLFRTASLVRKEIFGPGLPSRVWNYQYPNAAGSTMEDACYAAGTCAASKWVKMTDPEGNLTQYTYSNRFGETEGKLLQTDYYQGASTLLRSEVNVYASPAQGPYPSLLGSSMVGGSNSAKDSFLTPLKIRTISQQGKQFKWEAKGFNAYGHVAGTTRSSDLDPSFTRSDVTDYYNNVSLWVIGQTQMVRDSADGVTPGATVFSETVYNAATALPTSTSAFGELKQSFTYYANGLLNTVKDALNHTYTFSNYQRGIAQRIDFPDTRFISAVVDVFGQLTSVTDPLGNTTGYGYDVMGRMTAIDRPAGWSDSAISFAPSAEPVYGLPAGHWRQTIHTGNKRTVTMLDALWRPVVVQNYDAGNVAGTISQNVTRYNGLGRASFVSYPQRSMDPNVYNTWANPAVTPNALGTRTTYDALGRPLQVSQDAELGSPLITSYVYPPNEFKTQVTDPRLAVTTTSFQAFDNPSTDAPILVQLPESVTTMLARDKYGKTVSITRSGPHAGGVSLLTRSYVYDASQRLCRVNEPETGSSVTAYDTLDNVAWSATGMSITGTGCGYEQVAAAARTTRSYDVMNRVTGVDYPVGTGDIGYTYDAAGNVATATAAGVSSAQDVAWSYGARNTLGLPTSETLAVDGFTYTLQYGYDALGTLKTLTYPDARVVDYLPNALGQANQAGSYASGVSYFPDGDVASYQYGNGITFAAQKNARTLPNNLTYALGAGLLYSQDLTYDANANLTNVTDLSPGAPSRSKTMGYDALNRLTSAVAPALWGTETYTYDALDNIRSITRGGVNNRFEYNALNRLTRIANAGNEQTLHSYDYDTKGNVTTRDSDTLSFDEANRLLAYAGKGGYRYDAWARRVKRADGSGVTQSYYLYSQAGQMLFEHDLTTNKLTDYVYLGGKLVAKIATDAPVPALQAPARSSTGNYTVSWTAISGATSYVLEENVDGGAWSQVYSGTNLSWNASGKTHGHQYGYRAKVCLSTGCGNYGTAVSVTVDLSPETAPTLSVPNNPSPDYTVSWTAVATATSYEVQESGSSGVWSAFYSGSALSKSVTGHAGGVFNYQARACNTYGCGSWSATATTVVNLPPGSAPVLNAPGLSSNGSYTINWGAIAGATKYTLEQSANGGAYAVVQDTAALSWNASGKPAGSYAYRAKACNPAGCSAYSATATVTVTYPPTGAPSVSTPASNITGSFTVGWTGVATATSYTLQESVNGGAWITRYNGAGGSYAVSATDGSYAYRAQACNVSGCGPWSATATTTVEVTPAMPTLTGYKEFDPDLLGYQYWYISWGASPGATRYDFDMQVNVAARATVYQGTGQGYQTEGRGTRKFWVRACKGASNCSAWNGPLSL